MKKILFILLTFISSEISSQKISDTETSLLQNKAISIIKNLYSSINNISDSAQNRKDREDFKIQILDKFHKKLKDVPGLNQVCNDYKSNGETTYDLNTFLNEMINNKYKIRREIEARAGLPYKNHDDHLISVKVKVLVIGQFYDEKLDTTIWMDYYLRFMLNEKGSPSTTSLRIVNSSPSKTRHFPDTEEELQRRKQQEDSVRTAQIRRIEDSLKIVEANRLEQKKAAEEEIRNAEIRRATEKRIQEENREAAEKEREWQLRQRRQNKIQARERKHEDFVSDKVINNRTVIKHYLGIAIGTAHPVLEFKAQNPFGNSVHSGFAQFGFSASLDGEFRIKNGIGIRMKADVVSFSFNTTAYENNVLSPSYSILNKRSALISEHYYLLENLMTGINFNIGKYKFLFEFSLMGGLTTGMGPSFKYLESPNTILASSNQFLIGYGYQIAGAFRIRCSKTFAIKVGASYWESRIPNYNGPTIDNYGNTNNGELIIRAVLPQISLVGTWFNFKERTFHY